MTEPVLLEVPASSLSGFSVKIRCGPQGTRFPIISRSPSLEDTASSPFENPLEDVQASDSLERAVHLSFGDDVQGAFLKLSFTPDFESGIRDRSNLWDHSIATSSTWPNSTPFSAPAEDPMLWNDGRSMNVVIPTQAGPPYYTDQGFFPEQVTHDRGPTVARQISGFTAHLNDIQDISGSGVSPSPHNIHDIDSLMTVLSRDTYTPATASLHSPGSRSSPSSNGALSQVDSPPSQASASSPVDSKATENPLSHPYTCPQPGCNRKFKREYNLSLHIRTHEPRPKKRFSCAFPECNGLGFSRKHDLFRHICNLHSDAAAWTCDWCGSEFPNSETLVAHVRVHYGNGTGK